MLWVVFLMFGVTERTIGLMHDVPSCIAGARGADEYFDRAFAAPLPGDKGRLVWREDVTAICVWAPRAPRLGSRPNSGVQT